MKKPALHFLPMLLAVQTFILGAQTVETPKPRFSLVIFYSNLGGSTYHDLRVVETNTSNDSIFEHGCLEFKGVFRISILYNGSPLKERDETARKKREVDARSGYCRAMDAIIGPGESWERYLAFGSDYPMTEPGTYEITVSRDSDLEHPEKGVTIKSNTVTVVVPEQLPAKTH
ncbi:MAG: hypothetical protein ABR923_12725 [Terracidiphilus sp.]|jgi:hypothetical protein